jgi:hypothetical protein
LLQVTFSWWGHEIPLEEAGFYPVGKHASDPPFEIPAMGLGLFSMRKDAWSGFNPLFRGFGGEEGYLHEKVRRMGGKAICLPALRWIHRFTREGQTIPYPLNLWNKVRNHVLGHLEIGLPLDRLREEFIGRCNFPEDQWQQILGSQSSPPRRGGSGVLSATDLPSRSPSTPDSQRHARTGVGSQRSRFSLSSSRRSNGWGTHPEPTLEVSYSRREVPGSNGTGSGRYPDVVG